MLFRSLPMLKGERFDGHSFVSAALSKSALAIIEHGQAAAIIAALQDKGGHGEGYCLLSVPDTLAAYQALAQLYRRRLKAKVIGITGSSGKTTTKEMTACALSSMAVHKSKANENNETVIELAAPIPEGATLVSYDGNTGKFTIHEKGDE